MSEQQDFCLKWSSYSQQLSEAMRGLLDQELLVDVTLACDGRSLRAHRAILSACSSYFQELFQESAHPHPIVILKDVRYQELEALVKFMYHGEVTVNNTMLPGFLRTAETLHIRGLTDNAFMSNTSTMNSRATNNNRRAAEESGSSIDHEEVPTPLLRVPPKSAVYAKPIKLEQPTTSQCSQRLLRHSQPQEMDGIRDEDDEDVSEQDTHCTTRPEELPHISQDHYTLHRAVTPMDGLNQLVMPVMQDNSLHSAQYIGVPATIPNQHHQLTQQQQSPQHHQITQHMNPGTSSSGSNRPFRQRVLYNQEQLLQLEAWYRQDRYPSGALMREYADALASMVPNTPGSIGAQPMRQNVDYWFQNRRRKDFHPEVMQQREKKKLAKTLWGHYNGNGMSSSTASSEENQSDSHAESNITSCSR